MLPPSQRQEALSRAYVRAVAAQAGLVCGDIGQDFGIDMFLREVQIRDGQYWDTGPQLDLQLRSTTTLEPGDETVAYDLDVRTYNLLRENVVHGRPRILVLLVLPENYEDWIGQTTEELIIRRCAYWLSLRGSPPTTAKTTKRVQIPKTNVFSVDNLSHLMGLIRGGEMP
jgi:hypothetical protein